MEVPTRVAGGEWKTGNKVVETYIDNPDLPEGFVKVMEPGDEPRPPCGALAPVRM